MRRSVRWPKAPRALGTALHRMASNLRAAGIDIQFSRADTHGRHLVSLVYTRETRKTPSVAVSSRASTKGGLSLRFAGFSHKKRKNVQGQFH